MVKEARQTKFKPSSKPATLAQLLGCNQDEPFTKEIAALEALRSTSDVASNSDMNPGNPADGAPRVPLVLGWGAHLAPPGHPGGWPFVPTGQPDVIWPPLPPEPNPAPPLPLYPPPGPPAAPSTDAALPADATAGAALPGGGAAGAINDVDMQQAPLAQVDYPGFPPGFYAAMQAFAAQFVGANAATAAATNGVLPAPQNYLPVPGAAHAPRFQPVINPFANTTPSPLAYAADMSFKGLIAKDKWTATSQPEHASAWIHKLMTMCATQGLSGNQFMSYMVHAFECGPPLTWLHNVSNSLDNGTFWTPALFTERFLGRFAGQVRDPHAMALSKLIHGLVQQGTDSVEAYSERFLAVARSVPEISGAALCQCYILGLNSDLKSACILTLTNTEWTNIYDLMNHASSVALRARLTSSQVASPGPYKKVSFQLSTPTLPDPEARWTRTQRLAIVSQMAQLVDNDTDGAASAPAPRHVYIPGSPPNSPITLALNQAGMDVTQWPQQPQRSTKRDSKSAFNGFSAVQPQRRAQQPQRGTPKAQNGELPRFCTYEPVYSGHTAMVADGSKSIYFHPPDRSQSQLAAVPGYGAPQSVKLDSIPGASDALKAVGVCPRCRTGRHPKEFCDILSKKGGN